MSGFLQSVVLQFLVLAMELFGAQVTTIKHIPGCDDGWFGRKCSLMCHCSTLKICGMNGECMVGCQQGFFGPGCQYVDLVYSLASTPSLAYLSDNDDTTCNPDKAAKYIRLTFVKESPVLWLRIVSKNEVSRFTLVINGNRSCENERRFRVNPRTVDVTCDLPIILKEIVIDGLIVPSVCSLYITPGRNVALRQPVQQTGNADNSTPAANAVDGSSQSLSCSATQPSSDAKWQLVFNIPHYLVNAVVYNTHNRSNQYKLKGFSLYTVTGDNVTTNNFTDTNPTDSPVYDVPLSPLIPVVTVLIKPSKSLPDNDKTLTLCEVALLGEHMCPEGTFGLECDQNCTCAETDICNMVTGTCVSGCPHSKFGFNCQRICSENCLKEICYYRTGECIECTDGHHGAYCEHECDMGKYGRRCALNCSRNCHNGCDTHTGHCSCKQPFMGIRCTECPVGKYGPGCLKLCPRACLKRKCDATTGECLGCVGSRVGLHCEECPDGYYGSLCFRSCSPHCLNMTCDNKYGNCTVCMNDYTGPLCLEAPWQAKHWVFVVIAVPAFVILITVLCLCWAFILRHRLAPTTPMSTGSTASEGTLSDMSTNVTRSARKGMMKSDMSVSVVKSEAEFTEGGTTNIEETDD